MNTFILAANSISIASCWIAICWLLASTFRSLEQPDPRGLRAMRNALYLATICALAMFSVGNLAAITYYGRHHPPAVSKTWDEWFVVHQKTCGKCGGSPDQAMCEEAFAKLQKSFMEWQ